MVWDGMFCAKGLERMECSMVWDGMPCTKGLERMGCPMVWDGMPCTKGLERMRCPMVWDGMPEWYGTECAVRRYLVRYFLYLNCDNPTRRKLRAKKNGLSQYNNDLF